MAVAVAILGLQTRRDEAGIEGSSLVGEILATVFGSRTTSL